MARDRRFPYEHHAGRTVLFHPVEPNRITGDVLEIGPGRGDFIFAMAESQLDRQFVAIELRKKRFYKLIPRIEQRGLTNILLVQDDARVFVPERIPHETFTEIYVLFPDPWPKKRHAYHRLLSVPYLWILARRLRPGGELVVATDDAPYAAWCRDGLDAVDILERVDARTTLDDPLPTVLPTFFEEKWRAEGRTLFYLKYRRTATALDLSQGPPDVAPLYYTPTDSSEA